MENNNKNVFVYGTLVFPDIVFSLTGNRFQIQEATLKGYKRFKIMDDNIPRKYPAIYKNEDGIVNGRILMDVDSESLKILDFFEDDGYEKQSVKVQTDKGEVIAISYVWKNDLKYKLTTEWSEPEFKEKYLEEYVSIIIPRILDKI